MAFASTRRLALVMGSLLFLAACEGGNMPSFLQKNDTGDDGALAQGNSTRLVERDVEAPEVFQLSETGLWDGRPSLGGVWVAHPEAKDPERVIIRNRANDKFVVGALFRREREVPGPRFQVSSDAAAALGLLAGQPAELNVTALRREEVPVDPEPAPTEPLGDVEEIEEGTLDPIAAAAAALDEAEGIAPSAETAPPPKPVAAPAPSPTPASSLTKPFIQIGIFNVESNAGNTAESLRRAGMVPTVKRGTSSGKAFWRVIVGPATNATERAALLKKIKALGFSDAYFVTN